MQDLESKKAITRIHDGIRWDVRNVNDRVWLSRSTIDNKRPGEWIPTQEAVVERWPMRHSEGQWLVTRWSVISDFPARGLYYKTLEGAMKCAKEHVDLQV